MNTSTARRPMRTFYLVWIGQLVSTLGTGLSGFALGVWLYETTGSVTLFALNTLAFVLPMMLFSPFAGALVDRWDRRTAMLVADSGAGLGTIGLLILLSTGTLEIWHIYLVTAWTSFFNTFQWPAYSAATTLMVPKEHLGRASGMVQMGEALSQIVTPIVAAFLIVGIGIVGVIAIDLLTFLFAVTTLVLARIPSHKGEQVDDKPSEEQSSLWDEVKFGWRYIVQRPGLLGLLLYFAGFNLINGIATAALIPMALDLFGTQTVGVLGTLVGLGALGGTLLMSTWGGPKDRVLGVLGGGALSGIGVALAGLRPSAVLIVVGMGLAMFFLPILGGSSQGNRIKLE
ncbi:MAG: MFS transporter, partial [Chloroflexi bacterium]|nr:MFS transporter [Chloroflexota bacterium]